MITASTAHHSQKQKKLYILLSPYALFCLQVQYHSKIEVLYCCCLSYSDLLLLIKIPLILLNFIVKEMVFCVHEPLILYNYDKILN